MAAAVPVPGSSFTAEDGTVSTVLPESYDPNYEPTEEELEEYAAFIGIDPAKEPGLMWIAAEGLRTPLPPEWRACQTNDDEVYYFNFKTGESLWDHPMDETFKQRVTEERAKLLAGGKGAGKKGDAASASAKPAATATAVGQPTTSAGSTKAIADALFAKPALGAGKNPPLPPPLSRPGLPQPLPTRFGANPDVSDILGLNVSSSAASHDSNSSFFAATSGLLGAGGAPGLSSGRYPPSFASPTTPAPTMSGAKDIEASIRRRIEEEYAPRRRQLSIEMDRRYIEEKHAAEEEVKKLRSSLDASWELEKSKSSAQRMRDLQRELKEIEESWERRLAQVGEQVSQATKELERRRGELKSAQSESVAELKRRLERQAVEELSKRRRLLEEAAAEEVSRVTREQEEALSELRRREAAAMAAARTQVEAENAKRLQLQLTQSEKVLVALEEEIAQLRQELVQSQADAPAQPPASPVATAAADDSSAKAADEKKRQQQQRQRIEEAEAEAAAHLKTVAADCAVEFAKKQHELKEEQARLQAELDELNKPAGGSSSLSSSLPGTPLTAAASGKGGAGAGAAGNSAAATVAAPSLTAAEIEKLRTEEARLQKDMETAVRTFSQQTEALMSRQQKQGTAAGSSGSVSSRTLGGSPTTSSPWANSLSLSAAASSPVGVKLQQLEAKHEERMRQLREENKKAFKARGLPNPRESETYARLFVERQRAWNAKNPAPTADSILPKLQPVPQFVATVGDMPEVPAPSPEAVKAAVAAALERTREQHREEQEKALSEMQSKKHAELDQLRTAYREKRLAEVKDAVEKHRSALAERREAAAKATSDEAARKAGEDHRRAAGAAAAKVGELRTRVRQCEDNLARSDAAHAKHMAEVDEQVAALEESIKRLEKKSASDANANANAVVTAAKDPHEHATLPTEAAAADLEPEVLVQPDYTNYLSAEEASAEEAALHAKWRAVLEGLQQEIRKSSSSAAAVAAAAAAAAPAAVEWRPPTAPTGAIGPSLSTATPTPMPWRANRFTVGDHSYDGVPPHPQPLSHQLSTNPLLYSVNASTIWASPVAAARDPNTSLSGASGIPLTPYTCASLPVPHRTAGGLSGAPTPTPAPAPFALYAQPQPHGSSQYRPSPDPVRDPDSSRAESGVPVTAAGGDAQASPNDLYAQRLARLHELVRQRRRELRARQERLEALREDWHHDMRRCKERRDAKQAALLKEVKAALESEARTLNREVVHLKAASERLRREEMTHLPVRAVQDAGTKGPDRLAAEDLALNTEDGAALLQTLMRIAERTERLETLLLRQTLSQPRRSSAGLSIDPTAEPDPSEQQQQQKQPRSRSGDRAAPRASKEKTRKRSPSSLPRQEGEGQKSSPLQTPPHGERVARWLQEQQR